MSLGRGFSIPQEKVVIQNGDPWIPVTPEKQIVLRSSIVPPVTQANQPGTANWGDLLGIYSGFLQDRQVCSEQPQNLSPTGFPGLNHQGCSNQDFVEPDKSKGVNPYPVNVGYYQQNLGNDCPDWGLNPLAEILQVKNPPHAPHAKEASNTIMRVMDAPSVPGSSSYVKSSNWAGCSTASSVQKQDHSLHSNQYVGSHSLQLPHNESSVPYLRSYNLNLPSASEASAASSVARVVQVAPVTPDQRKQPQSYHFTGPQRLLIEGPSQGRDKLKNVFTSPEPVIAEKLCNELPQNIPPTTSAAASTLPKEKNVSDDGSYEGIDLNKTPNQKTPKRKKHRPKVVVEGKPKRTPKTAAPKINTPEGNSSGKRKYVRKKDIKTSTPQQATVVNEVEASNVRSAAKSCRRVLNFDLENGIITRENSTGGNPVKINTENKTPLNLDLNSQYGGFHMGSYGAYTAPAVKDRCQNLYNSDKQIPDNSCRVVNSTNQMPLALTGLFATGKDHTLNVIARNLSTHIANTLQSGGQNGQTQSSSGGIAQFVLQATNAQAKIEGQREPLLQSRTQFMDEGDVNDKRGSKRVYAHTEMIQPQNITLMGTPLFGRISQNRPNDISSNSWQGSQILHKKKKVEDNFQGASSRMPSCSSTPRDCSRNVVSNRDVHANTSPSNLNGGLSSHLEGASISREANSRVIRVPSGQCFSPKIEGCEFQNQKTVSGVHLHAEQKDGVISRQTTEGPGFSPLASYKHWHLESPCRKDPQSTQGNHVITFPDDMSIKLPALVPASSSRAFSKGKAPLQENTNAQSYRSSFSGVKGPQERQTQAISIDEIIFRLKGLDINGNGKDARAGEQGALVPYGGDGAIVPYEKKRRPRPKVDLDPETNRLWNLLMGKEGSQSAETMDKDKEKWWQEERKVFRGRVDSFIARMHLVQGDRRFSKWKGSVVDSVIGVYLTQNVSDHLSSSAFMSLAAKFPLRSPSIRQTCSQNAGRASAEEREVRVIHPDGTESYEHSIGRQPVYNQSSVTSSESSEQGAENLATGTRAFLRNDYNRRIEEEVISSQSSTESFFFQATEEIRSSSGSNSETEDQISQWNFSKPPNQPIFIQPAERLAPFLYHQNGVKDSLYPEERPLRGNQQSEHPLYNWQNPGSEMSSKSYASPSASNLDHHQQHFALSGNNWLNMTAELEEWEANFLGLSGNEGTSSLTSADPEITQETGKGHAHINNGQKTGNCSATLQNAIPVCQPLGVEQTILNKHFQQPTDLPSQFHSGSHHTLESASACVTESTRPVEAHSKSGKASAEHLGNKPNEPTEAGPVPPTAKPSSQTDTNTSNARPRKAEKEKAEAFDWDSLRREVLLRGGRKERCKDTMDSLDYEALQRADVRQISETIKERGMNNMLAERIKDFLNRLVRDHGSINLEWLRDVPPEKSKDYLLSIRGLGLKSVECVRLLTLHHLAFPVDTNVGRIAVRLGWVPLQPLPESLQLHLLELYPVLESIQKYLWPRLCKLDQGTLYELHYQMITFGKVFCTKREPNCNACPMRGECRHFASAFASARLALPGPEERRVVSSTAPLSADSDPDVMIKPMPLPPAEDNPGRDGGFFRGNCEPIVEEPTTPEPAPEVSESDIEDIFYEDPNEIPTIKLNIEEFTSNLQSFMQEHMEVQEGDMSKALVALNPEFASIPMPKLKNVSRLRTEHQVYELPDSHPLLKGLDRREPDDPSPYLLAIWTPGETANSIQPPESKCQYEGSGRLCDEKTCFSCNSVREASSQTVRGTLLIPCRTAMRGSFPLNGTYFQVNEVFADHESSLDPIEVPRNLLWNLPRRTVFFGTSVSTIFKGLTTEGIQYCFWKGFVCVRGFDQKSRAPRPLQPRLHYPASKLIKKTQNT